MRHNERPNTKRPSYQVWDVFYLLFNPETGKSKRVSVPIQATSQADAERQGQEYCDKLWMRTFIEVIRRTYSWWILLGFLAYMCWPWPFYSQSEEIITNSDDKIERMQYERKHGPTSKDVFDIKK